MLSLERAERIIAQARAKGRALNLAPLTVVELDAGGHVVASAREDHSGIARIEIATGKAWGGLGLGIGSRALFERWNKGGEGFLTGFAAASQGRMVPVPGGVLVLEADRVIGAVGVSGDNSDNDEICAVAGIEAAGLVAKVGG